MDTPMVRIVHSNWRLQSFCVKIQQLKFRISLIHSRYNFNAVFQLSVGKYFCSFGCRKQSARVDGLQLFLESILATHTVQIDIFTPLLIKHSLRIVCSNQHWVTTLTKICFLKYANWLIKLELIILSKTGLNWNCLYQLFQKYSLIYNYSGWRLFLPV